MTKNSGLVSLNRKRILYLVIVAFSILGAVYIRLNNLVVFSNFRTHSLFIIFSIYSILILIYKIKGVKGYFAGLVVTVGLFLLPLLMLWHNPQNTEFLIGGLLPWTDSSGYYWDASRLLEGNTLSSFSSRRPLFASFLGVLLSITQQNLQLTLLVLVSINGLAAWLLAQELKKTHGAVIACFILTLIFLFYTRFIGTTMTENLGLILGMLSLTLLWRGIFNQNINLSLFGIFILTLGLNARAGAFFILPCLLLWGGLFFKSQHLLSWRFILLGLSAIFLGFLLNSALLKLVGDSNAQSFSNFSYVLYGLLTKGNWTTVLTDFPELQQLTEIERSKQIYALAFNILRDNPLSLVQGSIKAWKIYFLTGHSGAFGFIKIPYYDARLGYRLIRVLFLFGMISCVLNIKKIPYSFILLCSIGIFLSVPFVPPWDADYMRAYATTIPYLLLVLAMGIDFISIQMRRFITLSDSPHMYDIPKLLPVFTISLILFLGLGITTIKLLAHPATLTYLSCPANQEIVYFRRNSGSHLSLVEDRSQSNNALPNIQVSHFASTLYALDELYPEVTDILRQTPPNTTIINTLDLKKHEQVWLFIPSQLFPKKSGIYAACRNFNPQLSEKGHPFFDVKSIIKLHK